MLAKPKVTIILANLGTPDAPTVPAVRTFLQQFLSDQRVIEIPKPLWQIILRLFILPFRPKRVAQAYAQVWAKDSPMREILLQQVEAVRAELTQSALSAIRAECGARHDLWQSEHSDCS